MRTRNLKRQLRHPCPRVGDITTAPDGARVKITKVVESYDCDDEMDGWLFEVAPTEEAAKDREDRERSSRIASLERQLAVAMLPPDDERERPALEIRRADLRRLIEAA